MNKPPKSKFILPKGDRITSISIFVIVVFILCITAAFIAGINFKERSNIAAATYKNQVKDCVIYNDQISITSELCDEHTDCRDDGFCFMEFERCAYFEKEAIN